MSSKSDLLNRRKFIVKEIFVTEQSYDMGLQQLNQVFYKHLKEMINRRDIVLKNPRFIELFELLIKVEKTSESLKQRFCTKLEKSDTVAECFDGFSELITTYFEYIRQYHELAPEIRAEKNSNIQFAKFLNDCHGKLNDTVEAFLITPVQRPPRYRLLLNELVKNTPPDHEDYPALQEAHRKICIAISEVDQRIVEFDEGVAMCEFQSKITSFEVQKVGRRMFFQGSATKFSRSWTNNRYFVLFSDCLLIAEPAFVSQFKINKLYNSGDYLLMNVRDNDPFINAIDVLQKDKSFRANLENAEAKRCLLNAFDEMLSHCQIKRETIENKGFAPVWIPDDLAPNCMECHKPFSFFNRRHHCRRCGDCVCKECSKNKIILPGNQDKMQRVCNRCYLLLTTPKPQEPMDVPLPVDPCPEDVKQTTN